MLLVAVALTMSACARIHGVCDPQIAWRQADRKVPIEAMQGATCTERVQLNCQQDAACLRVGNVACFAKAAALQHHLEALPPRDPSANIKLCKYVLAECP